MSGSWAEIAHDTMSRVRTELIAAGETDRQTIADAIDAAYPFGERQRWPYKAWLATRRRYFTRHSLPLKSRMTKQQAEDLWHQKIGPANRDPKEVPHGHAG